MDTFSMILVLVSGVSWSIVYLASIKVGFKDKIYAMPFWALALNFAWEVLHAVFGVAELGFSAQSIINILWAVFDCGILYTYFKYGAKEFPSFLNKKVFLSFSILGILISFIVQYAFIKEFSLVLAGAYSAYLQNLLMSVLFIAMLLKRRSSKGQNLMIAIFKWLGTLAPTLLFGIIGSAELGGKPNQFVLTLGILICLTDLVYICLLCATRYSEKKEANISA